MKINILLCDTFPGYLPPFIESYVSLFTNMFDAIRKDINYQIYDAKKGELPGEIHKEDLYLIPGCKAGAYDDLPWIPNLIEFIKKAHKEEAKLAGICFGHQVIAQALGGKVVKADKGWGIGMRTSRILSPEGLSYFPEGEMTLLYNHNDQVIELPSEAKLLATSDFCPNESFMIGNHILTFQGHPEYTVDYCRYLLENHAGNATQELKEKASMSLKGKEPQGNQVAGWILDLL